MNKKYLIALMVQMGAATMSAQQFESDGCQYTVLSAAERTVQFTAPPATNPTELVMPASVEYNGTQYTVVSIGANSFATNTNLATLSLPATLRDIQAGAFFKTTKLKQIYTAATTPPDIETSPFATAIYTNATLHVPEGTWLAYQTSWRRFYKIEEPGAWTETIDGISYQVVSPTSHLAAVTSTSPKYSGDIVIPSTITSRDVKCKVAIIGGYAFDGCSELTSVQLPDSLLAIVNNAFRKCTRLKRVDMPASVRVLSEGAFKACDSLVTVTFPMALKRIENIVFQNCKQLREITLPDSLEYIGPSSFATCSSLVAVHGGSRIRELMSGAFNNCTSLTDFAMPAAIEFIGVSALANIKVNFPAPFPSTLRQIDGQAFKGNTALQHVVIPDSCKKFNGSSQFTGCTALETVVLPKTVTTSVSSWGSMFSGCSSLKSVRLPENMNTIPMNFFQRCAALESVDIPDGVITIANWSFNATKALRKIKFPPALTGIALAAFQESGLDTVVVPATVVNLGNQVFSTCPNLKSIRIEGPVTALGSYFARRCPELTEIVLPATLRTVGRQAFAENPKLKTLALPDSTDDIYQETLMGCTALDTITLPTGIHKVPVSMFKGCTALRAITFRSHIDTISATAFAGCTALMNVYAHRTVPPVLDPSAFDDATYAGATLHARTPDAYRAADGWSKFSNVTTGVEVLNETDEPKIIVAPGTITVPEGASVYNMQGMLVKPESLPRGIYIVRSRTHTVKVAVP